VIVPYEFLAATNVFSQTNVTSTCSNGAYQIVVYTNVAQVSRLELGVWARGGEAREVEASLDSVGQWEPDLAVNELLEVLGLDFRRSNRLDLHDLDGTRTRTMAGPHVTVTLSDSSSDGEVAVFTVHVVGTAAGIVTKPDTKVLDNDGLLLVNLLTDENLSLGLLDLAQH